MFVPVAELILKVGNVFGLDLVSAEGIYFNEKSKISDIEGGKFNECKKKKTLLLIQITLNRNLKIDCRGQKFFSVGCEWKGFPTLFDCFLRESLLTGIRVKQKHQTLEKKQKTKIAKKQKSKKVKKWKS